jgi:hypothetical protein
MPPLGTELIDDEAVAVLYRWIAEKDDHQQAYLLPKGE